MRDNSTTIHITISSIITIPLLLILLSPPKELIYQTIRSLFPICWSLFYLLTLYSDIHAIYKCLQLLAFPAPSASPKTHSNNPICPARTQTRATAKTNLHLRLALLLGKLLTPLQYLFLEHRPPLDKNRDFALIAFMIVVQVISIGTPTLKLALCSCGVFCGELLIGGLGVLAAWWVGLMSMGIRVTAFVGVGVGMQAAWNMGANVAMWWHRRGGVRGSVVGGEGG